MAFFRKAFLLLNAFRYTLFSLSLPEKALLLLCLITITLHHLYYFYQVPFMIDEVYAYGFFVSRSVAHIVSCYDEPNNHILYNLCCHAVSFVIPDPVWVMRLPDFLASYSVYLLVFVVCYRQFGFKVALLAVVWVALSYAGSLYSVLGRGYVLLSGGVLLAAFSVLYFLRTRQPFYFTLFTIASVGGFYTIPVYAFYFTGMVILLLMVALQEQNKSLFFSVLMACLWVVLLTGMLYLPVLWGSGAKALFANRWIVKNTSSAYFFGYILPLASAESLDYLLDLPAKGWAVLPGIVAGFYCWRKALVRDPFLRNYLLLLALLAVVSLEMVMAMQRFPPYRVWTPFVFLTAPVLAWLLNASLTRLLKNTHLHVAGLGLVLTLHALQGKQAYERHFASLQDWTCSQPVYSQLHQRLQSLLACKPRLIFAGDDNFFLYYLHYQEITQPVGYRLDAAFDKTQPYDFIIIRKKDPFPDSEQADQYRQVFDFEDARVFERK